MNPTIVHDEIQGAVETYANPRPENKRPILQPPPQKPHSHSPKQQGEEVIPFGTLTRRPVMRPMNKPQGAVHEVFVDEPSQCFHPHQAQERSNNKKHGFEHGFEHGLKSTPMKGDPD
jgi:hypothetical protein